MSKSTESNSDKLFLQGIHFLKAMIPVNPSTTFSKVNTALYDKETKRHYLNGHYLDDQLQCAQLMRAAARKVGTVAGGSILH